MAGSQPPGGLDRDHDEEAWFDEAEHDDDDRFWSDEEEEEEEEEEDEEEGPPDRARRSRRAFLGFAGATAGVAAVAAGMPASHALAGSRPDRGSGRGHREPARPGHFIRMWDDLPPFAPLSAELTAALTELGRPGGIMDAQDPLDVGPVRLITEPDLSPGNLNNPAQTAGVTFVGQFLDHDLTRDGGSPLGRPLHVGRSSNLRSPTIDLDSVYGGGPTQSPDLYTTSGPTRFVLESGGLFEDVRRGPDLRAIIPDPRNDENMVISGLQCALMLFHNAVAERVEAGGLQGELAFNEAQRLTRWHWQWTVVNEFLPTIVGAPLINELTGSAGRRRAGAARFFRPRRLQIPVEFQGAAYRFGHSMVRPSYRANLAGDNGQPFFALIFDADQLAGPDPATLLGGHRAPRRFIGWQTFFDFGDGEVKPNKRIDTSISTPLMRLPVFTIDGARAEDPGPTSLATRNLLRHITWALPSGQAIANRMGAAPLSPADLADLDGLGAGLTTSTPLWFYVLREAQVTTDGQHLGPVGGRIVAEVFIEVMRRDPTSYLGAEPSWRPTLPSTGGAGTFLMTDLLTLAGVDPTSRGQ